MAAAKAPAGGGGRLFGLPRPVAIGAIAVGLLLVVYFYYRSRRTGSAAQAALPASTDTTTNPSTAAPALGGTPDSGASAVTLSGSDLVNAFNQQEQLLTGAFVSQQGLISQLAGGYEQIAMTSEQQLGSLAAGLITLVPKPGSVSTSTGAGGGGGAKTKTAGSGSYDSSTGNYTTGEGVTIPPTVSYGGLNGPAIGAFK